MGSNTLLLIVEEGRFMRTATMPDRCSESNKRMRYARPWYILPFLVNLGLIFSASHLVTVINLNTMEESFFSLPCWIFYATLGVCAPTSVALSRLLPDPAFALLGGGLLTSAGLLWTGLETGMSQMLTFGVISGAGISLSLQAICLVISPYFIRKNIAASLVTLILSAAVMLVNPLVNHGHLVCNNIFLYLSPIILISSLIPPSLQLYSYCQTSKDSKASLPDKLIESNLFIDPYMEEKVPLILEKEDSPEDVGIRDILHTSVTTLLSCFNREGWAASFITSLVWLSWGAGIDTTWLSMGWHFHYFSTSTGLAALQLLLSFILLFIKMGIECSQASLPLYRMNLASNYMQLGLLGAGGMVLCLFPEFSQAFHNHLLFTIGFALQYDDLSDLYLIRNTRPNSVRQYKLIQSPFHWSEDRARYSLLGNICCTLTHIISLLLMSLLVMILGVQVANFLAVLASVPPLSFLCTLPGLFLISVAAVCTSLVKPDSWIGHTHHVLIM